MKNLVWGVLLMLFAFANAYQWTFNQPVRRVRWGLNQERVYYPVPQGMSARDFFTRAMTGPSQNLEKPAISESEFKSDGDISEKSGCHCGKCFKCILGQKEAIGVAEDKDKAVTHQVNPDESAECKCGRCDRCTLRQQRGSPRLFGLGGLGLGGYSGGYGDSYTRPPYYNNNYGYGYPEYYESYYEGSYPYEDPYYRPPYNNYW